MHHWGKTDAPGQIPGYATHVNAVSRAAKYMSAGGYIGIGIGVAAWAGDGGDSMGEISYEKSQP